MPDPIPVLETHPAYHDMVRRYRIALMAWSSLRPDTWTLRLGERTYCDQYVRLNFWSLTWSASDTAGQDWTQAHEDAAFEEAKRDAR